jgi:hypothetical protein
MFDKKRQIIRQQAIVKNFYDEDEKAQRKVENKQG